jgi:hypothetical protein
MKIQLVKTGLWLHTAIVTLAGAGLFLFPTTFGPVWPWALPPLAARFMGSLLVGGGVCTALAALAPEPLPVGGPALLGVGDMLIVSVGLLDLGEIGLGGRLVPWLAAFTGTAVLLWALLLLRGRATSGGKDPRPLSRGLRIYFMIHLAVVIPVGLTMYLGPGLGQRLWPWGLAPVNVRLLGAFFVGASILSMWSLRQKSWQAVRPLVGLYAVFTSLATLASIIHFSLFNPARIVTWAFFGLYLFVALGAWLFLGGAMLRQGRILDVEDEASGSIHH